MNLRFFSLIQQCMDALCQAANRRSRQWTRPDNHTLLPNVATDLTRSKSELMLENAFLHQQLITLQRQVKRPALTPRDRALLVLLARKLPSWKQALMIVQPDTLLRWHRDLFRWFWKRKSRSRRGGGKPPLAGEPSNIATLPPALLDDMSTDLLMACASEGDNDLLVHHNPRRNK